MCEHVKKNKKKKKTLGVLERIFNEMLTIYTQTYEAFDEA
jgi:hypothetical protein